jgi:hypothetical protein
LLIRGSGRSAQTLGFLRTFADLEHLQGIFNTEGKSMIFRLFFFALVLVFSSSVCAVPTQISAAQFGTLVAEGSSITESFSGFSQGLHQSPLVLANGTFIGMPMLDLAPWCDSYYQSNKCLDIGFVDAKFSQFANGTVVWGATIYYAGSGDQLQATVNGRGGVSVFILPPGTYDPNGTFIGFFDPDGLVSVAFHRSVPFGYNLAFDDVTTSVLPIPTAPAPILSGSLLATLSVLLLSIGCFRLTSQSSRPR